MGQVEESLGIRMGENKLHQLASGHYVHIYNRQETLKCSSFKLEEACAFFQFSMEPRQHDLPVSTKVDVQPFLYSNKDLLKLDGGNSELRRAIMTREMQEGRYAWAIDPWAWRLFGVPVYITVYKRQKCSAE